MRTSSSLGAGRAPAVRVFGRFLGASPAPVGLFVAMNIPP
jgi:hypothetical protein